VNLIGDHIDYLGFPVLPLALRRSVRIALRPRPDPLVRVANTDNRFGPVEFPAAAELEAFPPGSWGNYLKAGVGSALAAAGRARGAGFDALVFSDLPPAAGLSSSSALVVAAALAALHAAGESWEPLVLAEALAAGERFVGTEGGGMDQAVCLCALAGHALRIDFATLRVEPIVVPADWRLLVAPSLAESRKSAELRGAYNDRSRATRAALAAAAPGVSAADLVALLGRDPAAFVGPARCQPRLRHALSECRRVLAATGKLKAGDGTGFGRLMTESHASLRDDYQVSTPELDEIVELALGAGALGARLTGAGFGGCAIALCTTESLPEVRERLAHQFYDSAGPTARTAMFLAEPAAGASVEALA
jgi:galactokinase